MDRAAVAAIAALDDDVRRALYEHVRAAGAPVTREEAATAVGISRKLAAFHLDKLVDLGVLRSGFGPATGRRVGRAPRLYEPADDDIAVRVPDRSPELLASILVEAVTTERADERAEGAVLRVARERGVGPRRGRAGPAARRPGRRRAGPGHQRGAAGPAGVRAVPRGRRGAAAQLPVPPDGRDGAGAGLRAEPGLPRRDGRGAGRRDRVAAELAPAAGRVLRGAAARARPLGRRPRRAEAITAGMPTPSYAAPQSASPGTAATAARIRATRSRWPTAYCGSPPPHRCTCEATGRAADPRGLGQVGQRGRHQLLVGALQRGLLAVPAQRRAQVHQPVLGAGLAHPAPLGERERRGLDRPAVDRRDQEARGVVEPGGRRPRGRPG